MICDCDCDCDSGCSTCNASCLLPCNVCQGFCQLGRQVASSEGFSYSFGPFNRDDIIIKKMPLALYNQMGAAIQAMAAYGSKQNSGGWRWTPETRSFLYAQKTQELINGANSLRGGTTVTGVPPLVANESIVYGAYFTAIANAINGMKFNYNACHRCNVGCDVTCFNCNICQACYTCLIEGGGGCDCDCDA